MEQLYKSSSPCLDDHQFKQEDIESVRELSEACSQTVLKVCIWHDLDDLAFYGQSTSLQDQSPNGQELVTDVLFD